MRRSKKRIYKKRKTKRIRKQKGQNGGNSNTKLILKANVGGFFSNFNKLINYLTDHKDIVEIEYDVRATGIGNSLPFINEGEEIFNKLFIPYTENKTIDNTIIAENYENYNITYTNAINNYNENRGRLQPYHDSFIKYIKIKQDLQDKLNKLIEELKSDCEQVIGIFVRSSSLSTEQPSGKMPTRDDYMNAIKNIDTSSKKTKYFLRVDNDDDLKFYQEQFKPYYNTKISRSKDNTRNSLHISHDQYLTLEDLENTYLEVALLSQCETLVHCVSNMATASLYMNMNQKSICVSK